MSSSKPAARLARQLLDERPPGSRTTPVFGSEIVIGFRPPPKVDSCLLDPTCDRLEIVRRHVEALNRFRDSERDASMMGTTSPYGMWYAHGKGSKPFFEIGVRSVRDAIIALTTDETLQLHNALSTIAHTVCPRDFVEAQQAAKRKLAQLE